jgi:Flp pilus assembly protein TadG
VVFESARHVRAIQKGSALIEFSFVLIPLLGFVFLIMDVAWGIFARAALQEAVREGVRFGVVGQALSGYTHLNPSIQQVVESFSFGFINSSNLSNVTVTYYSPTTFAQITGSTGTTAGNIVQVSVSGISVLPMMPVYQSNGGWKRQALSVSASAADVMESNSSPAPP